MSNSNIKFGKMTRGTKENGGFTIYKNDVAVGKLAKLPSPDKPYCCTGYVVIIVGEPACRFMVEGYPVARPGFMLKDPTDAIKYSSSRVALSNAKKWIKDQLSD